jgi:RDD family
MRLRHYHMRVRRVRLLALLLDLAVCSAVLDLAAFGASGIVALVWPGYPQATIYPWIVAAFLLLCALLLRDARGGFTRKWLALEVRRADGSPANGLDSLVRNLPLLVPVWNLFDALRVARDGEAPRFGDERRGTRVVRTS